MTSNSKLQIQDNSLNQILSKVSIIETKSKQDRKCRICKTKNAVLTINGIDLCESEYCHKMLAYLEIILHDKHVVRKSLVFALTYLKEKIRVWKKKNKLEDAIRWQQLIRDFKAEFEVYSVYASDHKDILNVNIKQQEQRIQQLARENIHLKKQIQALKRKAQEKHSVWKLKNVNQKLRKENRSLRETIKFKLGA